MKSYELDETGQVSDQEITQMVRDAIDGDVSYPASITRNPVTGRISRVTIVFEEGWGDCPVHGVPMQSGYFCDPCCGEAQEAWYAGLTEQERREYDDRNQRYWEDLQAKEAH